MITTEAMVAMSIFALATSATPGPVNIISALSGANFGARRSTPFVLGATVSFVLILLFVGTGSAIVFDLIDKYSKTIAILSSIYMLYLAWKIAKHDGILNLENEKVSCPDFRSGLITQAINPKAWLVSFSAISIYVTPQLNYQEHLAVFSLLFFVICAISLSAWTIVGAQLAQTTSSILWLNRFMAGLLSVSVAFMLYEILL